MLIHSRESTGNYRLGVDDVPTTFSLIRNRIVVFQDGRFPHVVDIRGITYYLLLLLLSLNRHNPWIYRNLLLSFMWWEGNGRICLKAWVDQMFNLRNLVCISDLNRGGMNGGLYFCQGSIESLVVKMKD